MAKQDFYDEASSGGLAPRNEIYYAQVFTAGATYNAGSVKLLVLRVNSPGTITVELRNVVATKPGTTVHATGTFDGDGITTDAAGELVETTFDTPYEVTSGVEYAIVIHGTFSYPTNRLNVRFDSSGTYAGGAVHHSVNSGVDWTLSGADWDAIFEMYDIEAPWPVGTIAALAAPTAALTLATTGLNGAIAALATPTAALALATTGLNGTIAALAATTAALVVDPVLEGTVAAVASVSGYLGYLNLLSISRLQTFRRLVAAGNDKIYYEDI